MLICACEKGRQKMWVPLGHWLAFLGLAVSSGTAQTDLYKTFLSRAVASL